MIKSMRSNLVSITDNKKGLLLIAASTTSAQLSADIANTYAEHLLKQDWLLIPIPDNMSYNHAAMACCGLGPTFGAMQLMDVDALRADTNLPGIAKADITAGSAKSSRSASCPQVSVP